MPTLTGSPHKYALIARSIYNDVYHCVLFQPLNNAHQILGLISLVALVSNVSSIVK